MSSVLIRSAFTIGCELWNAEGERSGGVEGSLGERKCALSRRLKLERPPEGARRSLAEFEVACFGRGSLCDDVCRFGRACRSLPFSSLYP